MQTKRDREDLDAMRKHRLTREEKKRVNKRVNRLKQQQRIDDFSEMKDIR